MRPPAPVSRLEALATRVTTPAAGGSMVWRSWGAGPPLVLLHGASGSWTHWIRNILPLAARFRVLAPDMPGFGDSDTPPEPHTADGLADLVAAGLDVRVRTLVVIGAGGLGLGAPPPRRLLRLEPAMTAQEVRRVHRENLRILMLGDPESADDLAVSLQIENLKRARFKSGTIPQSDVLRRALPAIRARIAGIWGGRDAFTGDRLEECRRALASGRGEVDLRVIEGAGHWVPYEAADQVNAALLELLAHPS